jgi:hypothetical protein
MNAIEIATAKTPPQTFVWSGLLTSWTVPTTPISSARKQMEPHSPRISDVTSSKEAQSLEETLFDNAAELKIAVSQVAMHLAPGWRNVIFKQLDRLLDAENWDDESTLIKMPSFLTFLRFIVFSAPTRFPSLGVSPKGYILAAWTCAPHQIAVEFFASDSAAATFSIQAERSKQIVLWRGHVAELMNFIGRIGLGDCLGANLD